MNLVTVRFASGFVAFCVLFLFASPTAAHASRTSVLEMVQVSEHDAFFSLRSGVGGALALTSEDCVINVHSASFSEFESARIYCLHGLRGATFSIAGELGPGDVVMVRMANAAGAQHAEDVFGTVLTARARTFVVPLGSATRDVISHYVRLGFEHVFSGLDHVFFLMALVWQTRAASGGDFRPWLFTLLRLATWFTLAHLLTLSATALGLLHVPSAFAETMIAVSLVLVALDVGVEVEARGTVTKPALSGGVVAAFGLVHGLGFASALTTARLPTHAVALGLVAFNAGVEMAQIVLLLVALAIITLVPRLVTRVPQKRHRMTTVAAAFSAYAVGVFGVYLFIERASVLFERR